MEDGTRKGLERAEKMEGREDGERVEVEGYSDRSLFITLLHKRNHLFDERERCHAVVGVFPPHRITSLR